MKTYLVSGILTFSNAQTLPFANTHTLGPSDCMDLPNLRRMEALALQIQNSRGTIAQLAEIHSFQLLEETPPVPPAEPHLNECSVVMPPVDSPVLIEIAPGVLLRASRSKHAHKREDLLMFDLEAGGRYTGRPRWTHP